MAWSLSESSTSMVFADSVSPLLSLLQKPWGYLMSVTRPVLSVMQRSYATLMDSFVFKYTYEIKENMKEMTCRDTTSRRILVFFIISPTFLGL